MVPLTLRSHYSLMRGTAAVEQICRRARRLGYRSLALTDTDNLYGLWGFLAACRREGLRPIVGAEVTDLGSPARAVCLVENTDGYRNLCRLLSRRHTDPAFDLQESVATHAAGLVVLADDPALLQYWHAAGVAVAAAMPRRPLAAGHPLCRAARRAGVPLVATPGSFFLDADDFQRHRLLRAIGRKCTLSRLDLSQTAPPDAWLAAPAVYRRRFAVCPQALRASRQIAARLDFTGPRFGLVMPSLPGRTAAEAAELLRRAAFRGACRRYGDKPGAAVAARLERELRVIIRMGFSAYFLIVHDIVRRSPRICGRGSGAASLVAYCLGITNVCPLKHNLYFERFLNPGRTDPPDIDIDFAWDERDALLQRVLRQYAGHAAMVANHVCFQPRMAVRETARVYGIGDAEIRRVTRRLPVYWQNASVDPAKPGVRERKPASNRCHLLPPWHEILHLAHLLVGTPRCISLHPGGVVMTPDPIETYVPLETAPKGRPVIQWEKNGAESAGLVKIDLLGNRSLAVIRDALRSVRAGGVDFDEHRWQPEDDPATRAAVSRGQTMGCFYIESPAMRLLQKKTGVGDFKHLVIHSSIIRPAANTLIREYIRRLRGGRWQPIHPLLCGVLDETYGIMVYQEDVSRAAVALAGFSHAEADGLRRILSKKDRTHQLQDMHARFVKGARSRGLSHAQIAAVWDMMMSFAGYSFCKPHSASYARVSYQAAYLRVHHPAEFMAAVISNRGGFYSTFAYVSEARRMGLTILPPDVNRSDICWRGRGRRMRVGLMAIKGLAEKTCRRIVAQRRRQPYRGVADLLQRVRPAADEGWALVASGALDSLAAGRNRAELLWTLMRGRQARHAKGQQPLFDTQTPAPRLPEEDPLRRLRREFGVLGFLCDHHPMVLFRGVRDRCRTVRAAALERFVGRRVRFAGWLITGKAVRTRRGEAMQFLTFEDETGLVETTFFPAAYRRCRDRLVCGRPCLLSGRVEQDWGALTLTVEDAVPLALPRQMQAA